MFSLGERLRKAREDMGLTQAEFALRLGVDRKTVSHWESGRNAPRFRDVAFAAIVAEVDREWLAGDDFVADTRAVNAERTRGFVTATFEDNIVSNDAPVFAHVA